MTSSCLTNHKFRGKSELLLASVLSDPITPHEHISHVRHKQIKKYLHVEHLLN